MDSMDIANMSISPGRKDSQRARGSFAAFSGYELVKTRTHSTLGRRSIFACIHLCKSKAPTDPQRSREASEETQKLWPAVGQSSAIEQSIYPAVVIICRKLRNFRQFTKLTRCNTRVWNSRAMCCPARLTTESYFGKSCRGMAVFVLGRSNYGPNQFY